MPLAILLLCYKALLYSMSICSRAAIFLYPRLSQSWTQDPTRLVNNHSSQMEVFSIRPAGAQIADQHQLFADNIVADFAAGESVFWQSSSRWLLCPGVAARVTTGCDQLDNQPIYHRTTSTHCTFLIWSGSLPEHRLTQTIGCEQSVCSHELPPSNINPLADFFHLLGKQ